MMNKQPVLAMYDVRGIQKYVFRTAKVKDARGASAIVEDIILEGLKDACTKQKIVEPALSTDYDWYTGEGPKEFKEEERNDVHVLFIGGGNAYVLFRDRKLCVGINKLMAAYVMKSTYSLQLATAIADCTGDYQKDYKMLWGEMNQTKSDMIVSKPLGALPIMEVEVKTGYPLGENGESAETALKKAKHSEKYNEERTEERLFDNYVTQKGVDSMLAVVHIDGNNMGLRIQDLIKGKANYNEAVNQMRKISYHINHSFKNVFDEMMKKFNGITEEDHYFVRKILVAGDDITYVCNASIALASIEYFCRKVSRLTMTGGTDPESIEKYGFSVCAGAAFINSHFPFSIGYEVAEECCRSAKKRAKDPDYMDNGRIGNFVDFHICKNVHAQNLKLMRQQEYQIGGSYLLLTRPYYIATETEGKLERLNKEIFAFHRFKEFAKHFRNEENMPGSFVKDLRNTYAQGKNQMELLINFLKSREWKFPNGDCDAFHRDKNKTVHTAKWYDALELLDYCEDLEIDKEEDQDEQVSN